MRHKKEITLINEFKLCKKAPIGFSWGVLLLGVVYSIIKKEWKWVIIQLGLDLVTFGLSRIVMPFFYNKLYVLDLLKKGFVPTTYYELECLAYEGIVSRLQMKFLSSESYDILKKI